MYKQSARLNVPLRACWETFDSGGSTQIRNRAGGQMGWKRTGRTVVPVLFFMLSGAVGHLDAAAQSGHTSARWSEAKAQQWYAAQPWLVGANFLPADAINQLEMWQGGRFVPHENGREGGGGGGFGG